MTGDGPVLQYRSAGRPRRPRRAVGLLVGGIVCTAVGLLLFVPLAGVVVAVVVDARWTWGETLVLFLCCSAPTILGGICVAGGVRSIRVGWRGGRPPVGRDWRV